MNHACCSGRHYWHDPEYAQYCCNPKYQMVQSTRRDELVGAVCVRLCQGLWRGWALLENQNEQATHARASGCFVA